MLLAFGIVCALTKCLTSQLAVIIHIIYQDLVLLRGLYDSFLSYSQCSHVRQIHMYSFSCVMRAFISKVASKFYVIFLLPDFDPRSSSDDGKSSSYNRKMRTKISIIKNKSVI